jgi:hypothetical protein
MDKSREQQHLHTTGTDYIVEDIDLFVEARQPG